MDTKILSQDPTCDFDNRFNRLETLVTMILMASGGSLPITSVPVNFNGDLIDTTDRYLTLYTNNYTRLLALRVTGDFAIPGASVKLSLQNGDLGKIDTLASTGKVISETIWLYPRQTLYINSANTAFSLNGSSFRVLLFDPIMGG